MLNCLYYGIISFCIMYTVYYSTIIYLSCLKNPLLQEEQGLQKDIVSHASPLQLCTHGIFFMMHIF